MLYTTNTAGQNTLILIMQYTVTQCKQHRVPLVLKNSTQWAYYSHTGLIVYELYKMAAQDP